MIEIQEVLNNGRNLVLPVKAGAIILTGMLVAIKEGMAIPGAKTTGLLTAGVAQNDANNSGGMDGEVEIKIKRGVYRVGNCAELPVTQVDLFKPAYFADAYSVTATETGSSVVGKILALDDQGVIIEMI